MKTMILSVVVPLIIGPLTFMLMQGIKHASRWVDSLPPIAKRFAVLLIAAAITGVSHAVGVDVRCDPSGEINCLSELDKDAVSAMLSAAIAFFMHQYRKLSKGA